MRFPTRNIMHSFLSWFKDHIIRFPNIYRQLISLDHSDNLSNSQLTIFVKEEKSCNMREKKLYH